MEKCWASVIGNCCSKISGEHIFSQVLFPNTKNMTVSGFKWCNGEQRTVALASLKANILCRNHNTLLSELDVAGGHAFDVIRQSAVLVNKRQSNPQVHFKVEQYNINANALERWLLKTLINVMFESDLFIGPNSKIVGRPDEGLVKICYGLEKFRGKSGMYVIARVGANIHSYDSVAVSPLILDGTHVVGGFFHFRGFSFFLWLKEEELPASFDWIHWNSDAPKEWADFAPTWRFKKIKINLNDSRSSVIKFNWTT